MSNPKVTNVHLTTKEIEFLLEELKGDFADQIEFLLEELKGDFADQIEFLLEELKGDFADQIVKEVQSVLKRLTTTTRNMED